jgi:riboflavin kinase/FMN adenylyltransferase
MRVERIAGTPSRPVSEGCALTIGVFDGVHKGHAVLLSRTVETARRLGVEAAVVTFDRHPRRVIDPSSAPPMISTLGQRLEAFSRAGIDLAAVLEFDEGFAALSPEDFFLEVLVGALRAAAVVVGPNFRFGRDRSGDVDVLAKLGSLNGVAVEVVPPVIEGGEVVSSSRVRSLIAEGEVERAAQLLGHPFAISGKVVRGDGRGGGELGFPTANLAYERDQALPADGIYGGVYREKDWSWPAAVSVGIRPTFYAEGSRLVEAYLIDFEGDLYGHEAEVEIWFFVRPQERFEAPEDLVVQMVEDVSEIKERLSRMGAWPASG